MVRQHHQLNGHEFEQSLGDCGVQRSLVCYSSKSCKELDATQRLNNNNNNNNNNNTLPYCDTRIFFFSYCKQNKHHTRKLLARNLCIFPLCSSSRQSFQIQARSKISNQKIWIKRIYMYIHMYNFPGGSDGKASVYNAGDLGSSPGLGRSPGEGNGNPLQYCCLENPTDRGAWYVTVYGVAKS